MFWLGLSSWGQSGNCDDVNYLDRSDGFKFLASTAFGFWAYYCIIKGLKRKAHNRGNIFKSNFRLPKCHVPVLFCAWQLSKPAKPRESLYMKFVQIMQYKLYYKMQTFFSYVYRYNIGNMFHYLVVLIICSTLHFQDGTLNPY